ncbi:MAG: adenosine deaminase [Elusimicrobia bacterium]|nr:adenosine deaminase [Elusimicrobiota bacterium]MDE2314061.1 adenosine deaminase [Elusimicrobiota bacterium]
MNEVLKKLPKAELHCHLDGALRPQTILELGRESGAKLPANTLEELIPFVQTSPSCQSLGECLKAFDVICPLLRRPQALERAAYELVEDSAADNIRHVEVRFAPELLRSPSMSSEESVEAVLRGLKRGLKDFGTSSSVILCLFRAHGPRENSRAFSVLKKYFNSKLSLKEPAVAALDLAGDEARHPTREFADYYAEAKSLGIHTTCHAGETSGTENLRSALELKVDRIGHGVHLMEDDALLAEVVRRKVPLEIGITSNVRTKAVASLKDHPVRRFYQAGVRLTLNTDDRGVFAIDLTGEYAQALELGFSVQELADLSVASVDHLFLPPQERAALKARFHTEAAAALKEAHETV